MAAKVSFVLRIPSFVNKMNEISKQQYLSASAFCRPKRSSNSCAMTSMHGLCMERYTWLLPWRHYRRDGWRRGRWRELLFGLPWHTLASFGVPVESPPEGQNLFALALVLNLSNQSSFKGRRLRSVLDSHFINLHKHHWFLYTFNLRNLHLDDLIIF